MKKIEIYTDGACSGNPGEGGWGAVLMYGGHKKEISGYEQETTNNRMEMFAIISALRALKEPCEVNIYSDSAYCVNAMTEGWFVKWKSFGWRKSSKSVDQIKNFDLWQQIDELINKHIVKFIKVKGHSDNQYNNLCDKLATGEIEKHRMMQ